MPSPDSTDFAQRKLLDEIDELKKRVSEFEMREAEARLGGHVQQLKAAYFNELFQNTSQAIVIVDPKDRVLQANQAFERLFGYTQTELLGQSLHALIVPADRADDADLISDRAHGGDVVRADVVRRRKDGSRLDVDALACPLTQGTQPIGILHIFTDLTPSKRDSLTRLPNRSSFVALAEAELERALNRGYGLAVLVLELHNFIDIAHTYGYEVADALIARIAATLRVVIRRGADLARYGSQSFAIILPEIHDVGNAAGFARRLLSTLDGPFAVEGGAIKLDASIGIAIGSPDNEDARSLLGRAERALAEAKQAGRGEFRFHSDHMDLVAQRRVLLGQQLLEAADRDELVLEYQPQVEMPRGKIVGIEALVRWRHPDEGLLYPGEFISISEGSGAIIPIGRWVLEAAARQAREWLDTTGRRVPIAVNVSAVQFRDAGLPEAVRAALEKAALEPELLELEITESLLVQRDDILQSSLRKLRELGTHFSLDDFGKGYSSLDYLLHFPIQKLKLDRTFVHGIEEGRGQAAIASAVTTLGAKLDFSVIAEGVETASQVDFLVREGCTRMQGFYFSKPASAERTAEYLLGGEGYLPVAPGSDPNGGD